VELMTQRTAHKAVVDAMNKFSNCNEIGKIGCAALSQLLRQQSATTITLHATEIGSAVMAAMQGDVADVGLQLCGLAVLVSLAMSEQLEALVQLYGTVLQAMQQHSSDATVQHYGCWMLARCGNQLEIIEDIGEGVSVVVSAMQRHRIAPQIQRCGCGALLGFSSAPDRCGAMLAAGAHAVVVETMKAYRNDVEVQHFGCRLLSQLALGGAAQELLKKGAADAVVLGLTSKGGYGTVAAGRLDYMRTLHTMALHVTGSSLHQCKAAEAVLDLLVHCQVSEEQPAIHFAVGTLRSLANTAQPAVQGRAKKFMLEIFTEPREWNVGTLVYVVQLLTGCADGRQTPLDSQCVQLVMKALRHHSAGSTELTVLGLQLLAHYAKHTAHDICVKDLIQAMKNHDFDEPTQLAGCALLCKLPDISADSEAVLVVTLEAVASHSDSPNLINSCMQLVLRSCFQSDKETADKITPLLDAAKLLRANKLIAQQLQQLEALG